MITISLDEQGHFEENVDEPIFIAGIIYECESMEDVELERKKIKSYYCNVIDEVGNGAKFPDDLHIKNGSNNNKKVALVKQKVNETIGDFFDTGSYKGFGLNDSRGKPLKDGNGIYHIFVMLKSDDGKVSLLKNNTNKFAKDDYASNLYSHMASGIVNRVIFHNPLFDTGKEEVYVDIATRSSGDIKKLPKEKAKEFMSLGIKPTKGDVSSYYVIADDTIYRTLISQEMINSKETDVNLQQVRVTSISYNEHVKQKEFLWLSDSLCSYLGYKLRDIKKNRTNADDYLLEINKRVNELNPNSENLVFGYDVIDDLYKEAYEYYEKGDLFNALSIIFDASRETGAFANYYNETLFKDLENKVIDDVKRNAFDTCISNLSKMIISNNLDQAKLIYLLEKFEIIKVKRIDEFYKAEDNKSRALYRLYDAAVAGYCHIGNVSKAKEYYKKCLEYSKYVEISDILNTRNRYETCLCDNFEFKEANKEALVSLGISTSLADIRKNLLKENIEGGYLSLAKSKSQLAQTYALLRSPKAKEYFKKALSDLDVNSANYKITQSYLLHYYADIGDKVDFEKEASSYFDGRSSYDERYDYILECAKNNNPMFNVKYMAYVYVRGLYTFGMEDMDYDLFFKITSIIDDLKKINKKLVEDHPWELIYKYLALICLNSKIYKLNRNMSTILKTITEVKPVERGAKDFVKLLTNKVKVKGKTIEAIERYGAIEIFDKNDLIDLRNVAIDDLKKFLHNNFDEFKDNSFSNDYDECLEELDKYFRFMYR